jgi:hypothetical protein
MGYETSTCGDFCRKFVDDAVTCNAAIMRLGSMMKSVGNCWGIERLKYWRQMLKTFSPHFRTRPPNETVEKGRFWHFHRKAILEKKGVMGNDFFGLRVFRQSQQTASAAAARGC